MSDYDPEPVILRKRKPTPPIQNAPGTKTLRAIEENEAPPLKKSTLELRLRMEQARVALGFDRKTLALKTGVTEGVIRDFETGKSVPQGSILSRLNRVLKTNLNKP
jgi:ribosome-binding protein aMBF1 (putative translation factor)